MGGKNIEENDMEQNKNESDCSIEHAPLSNGSRSDSSRIQRTTRHAPPSTTTQRSTTIQPATDPEPLSNGKLKKQEGTRSNARTRAG
jgi:hypothetical protein